MIKVSVSGHLHAQRHCKSEAGFPLRLLSFPRSAFGTFVIFPLVGRKRSSFTNFVLQANATDTATATATAAATATATATSIPLRRRRSLLLLLLRRLLHYLYLLLTLALTLILTHTLR